jgi:hypothetical protein
VAEKRFNVRKMLPVAIPALLGLTYVAIVGGIALRGLRRNDAVFKSVERHLKADTSVMGLTPIERQYKGDTICFMLSGDSTKLEHAKLTQAVASAYKKALTENGVKNIEEPIVIVGKRFPLRQREIGLQKKYASEIRLFPPRPQVMQNGRRIR